MASPTQREPSAAHDTCLKKSQSIKQRTFTKVHNGGVGVMTAGQKKIILPGGKKKKNCETVKQGAIFKVHSHSKGASVFFRSLPTLPSSHGWLSIQVDRLISPKKKTPFTPFYLEWKERQVFTAAARWQPVNACDERLQKQALSGKNQGPLDQDEITWPLYGQLILQGRRITSWWMSSEVGKCSYWAEGGVFPQH